MTVTYDSLKTRMTLATSFGVNISPLCNRYHSL